MDGVGFGPIGWGINQVAAGAALVVGGAYYYGQELLGHVRDLIDGGPGAIPFQGPVPGSQPDVQEPDPPAPGAEAPDKGGAVGQPPLSLEDYYAQLAAQEVTTGVQSPLGPNDPNQYTQIPSIPQNDDPQAPLTSDFQPTPLPMPPGGLGQNTLIDFYTPSEYNPGAFDGYALKPKFKGSTGVGYRGTFDGVVASAVPEMDGDSISWKARVQALNNGAVKKTWNFDAGGSPPSSGDFQFIFDLEVFDTALDILDPANQFGIEQTRYYSLSAPAVPPQPQIQGIEEDWTNVPVGPMWTADTAPERFITVNDNTESDVTQPITPPLPTPATPQPVFPEQPVPTQPNNPTELPAVGANGQLLKLQELIKSTGADVHKIGEVLVNSQAMRGSLASIAKEVGRIEQKSAGGLQVLYGIAALLDELWNAINGGGDGNKVPAQTLEMLAACDYDANDELAKFSISYPEQEILQAILERVNDIPEFLQQHLAWKTPTCKDEKPTLEGQWVTTRWESLEKMDHSGRRLRKLFRYRTKSTRDLGQLSSYWRSFTWQAGSVCVFHKGAWWGTPQVWAASEEEGRRVIRFAGAEAGINPDQVGEWGTSGSNSPRYGMSGTMIIQEFEGYPWVAKRDGAPWPNYLALEGDP